MNRTDFLNQWNEAWTDGLWAIAWGKAVAGLTSAQAAWQPAPDRHSIWQIVHHVLFWREDALNRLAGNPPATAAEVAERNFQIPDPVSEVTWRATLERLAQTQERVRLAAADERNSIDRLQYVLPHDCYHFGQVQYVRALQGLPPLD